MEPNYQEVAGRIRALREDMGLTMQEMADATGRSLAEYQPRRNRGRRSFRSPSCTNAPSESRRRRLSSC